MSLVTLLVEYDDGKEPLFTANMFFMGGAVVAVQLDDALAALEKAEAEITDLKQQLATCCQLASMSSRQAQAFAQALDELKGAGAGYWKNETKAVP